MNLSMLKMFVGTGRFATVDFVTIKGTPRTVNGRVSVKKGTTGKGLSYDPNAAGNLIIWSRTEKSFKTIKAANVRAIRADGMELTVKKTK